MKPVNLKNLRDELSAMLEKLRSLRLDILANERDWKLIAQELGCEPVREEMVKRIRQLRAK